MTIARPGIVVRAYIDSVSHASVSEVDCMSVRPLLHSAWVPGSLCRRYKLAETRNAAATDASLFDEFCAALHEFQIATRPRCEPGRRPRRGRRRTRHGWAPPGRLVARGSAIGTPLWWSLPASGELVGAAAGEHGAGGHQLCVDLSARSRPGASLEPVEQAGPTATQRILRGVVRPGDIAIQGGDMSRPTGIRAHPPTAPGSECAAFRGRRGRVPARARRAREACRRTAGGPARAARG